MGLAVKTLVAGRALTFMDCDGVIYDTNRLKCDAFRFALAGSPEALVEALVAWHKRTGGVSRYVKLRHFFEVMHPVADPEAACAAALERFGAYCQAGYARLSPRPEALAFARAMGGAARVSVVSGSDECELRRAFDVANITHEFAGVWGSPVTKEVHIRRLLEAAQVAPEDALLIGDGSGDWDAARAVGMPFVFLAEMSEWQDGAQVMAEVGDGARVAVAATWAEVIEALGRG